VGRRDRDQIAIVGLLIDKLFRVNLPRPPVDNVLLDAERVHDGIADIGSLAHRIDTSELNPNALRAWVKEVVEFDQSGMTLLFQSFGFKHGVPLDADLVFDVRSLPNPFYDPNLRPLTGKDPAVIAVLAADEKVQSMLADIRGFLDKWLPSFVADNRSYVTVAIGCTGGEHRSVYFVEQLLRHFQRDRRVLARHRELSGS
jgi:UPF0042 nucleotide-binding protein